jgi:hypothetical protein
MLTLGLKFYADDPIVRDNDARVEVTEIAKYKLNDQYDLILHTFHKPGDHTKAPAVNVNTLGEVPDSSWFQNRHAVFPMTPDELRRGPNTGDGPSHEQPWQVIAAKTEGVTPGFSIRDPRGDVYFIKFDPLESPELATAAEVISTKFFYAIGFNVPEKLRGVFLAGPASSGRESRGHRTRSGQIAEARSSQVGRDVSRCGKQASEGDAYRSISVLRNAPGRSERHFPARKPARTSRSAGVLGLAEP